MRFTHACRKTRFSLLLTNRSQVRDRLRSFSANRDERRISKLLSARHLRREFQRDRFVNRIVRGGDLSVVVLLKSHTLQYSIDIKAPTEGKTKTRINWLLKQLLSEDAPEDLIVKVNWGYGRFSQGRIGDLRDQPDRLLWDNNGQKVQKTDSPNSFSLQWTRSLPHGKGRATAPILEGVAEKNEDFYRRVVEGIQPYAAKAPQLPEAQPQDTPCANINADENSDRLNSNQN